MIYNSFGPPQSSGASRFSPHFSAPKPSPAVSNHRACISNDIRVRTQKHAAMERSFPTGRSNRFNPPNKKQIPFTGNSIRMQSIIHSTLKQPSRCFRRIETNAQNLTNILEKAYERFRSLLTYVRLFAPSYTYFARICFRQDSFPSTHTGEFSKTGRL